MLVDRRGLWIDARLPCGCVRLTIRILNDNKSKKRNDKIKPLFCCIYIHFFSFISFAFPHRVNLFYRTAAYATSFSFDVNLYNKNTMCDAAQKYNCTAPPYKTQQPPQKSLTATFKLVARHLKYETQLNASHSSKQRTAKRRSTTPRHHAASIARIKRRNKYARFFSHLQIEQQGKARHHKKLLGGERNFRPLPVFQLEFRLKSI